MTAARMRLVPHAVEASVVLFIAAEALVFALIGSASWPVMGAWALAAVVVWLVARSVHSVGLRKALAVLLVAACVLFALEEGLFFLPAAAALMAAAFTTRLTQAASSS